ncbi:MAG: response regulator [Acidobacteriia bacterium]|nr:response regulator [Terriglobia bacterium]
MRRLLKINLEDLYNVVETGDPEYALALALQSKPNIILLDLRMPNYSGFELCRTFKSITSTQLIPIIIVTGEAGATTKQFCEELGATAYFEKPVDFPALRDGLEKILQLTQPERRSEVRINLRVMLKLKGLDIHKGSLEGRFEELCATENVSKTTFFCPCKAAMGPGSEVTVDLVSGGERFAGIARVIRCDGGDARQRRYAFRFVENNANWILQ